MKKVVYLIILAQFLCTSVWFAGNAVLPDLILNINATPNFLAYLTIAVQFGFIAGTFLFAFLGVSDKFSPSIVFAVSAFFVAVFNLSMALNGLSENGVLIFRFLTGLFLAGIYPVGMKIVADYEEKGLGKSLGFLVAALVLGTAFPHLLKGLFSGYLPWKYVIYGTSFLAIFGGMLIVLFVPDGPYRKLGNKIDLRGLFSDFTGSDFKKATLGYFGHMWELYAYWAFLPLVLGANISHHQAQLNINITCFLIIASGSLACIVSGFLSQYFGTKSVAKTALFLSGCCCLISPLFIFGNTTLLIVFLTFWGMVVVADSPLFSALIAQNCPPKNKGTALTIVNCIGFAITIVSIQLLQSLYLRIDIKYLLVLLVLGPLFGLLSQLKHTTKQFSKSSK